ncbi:MAG: ABC transporter permease [Candidatus Eremiobacteraeota bacterium]|nr:ABC transporter permease [Candidatus Eremiobacteraeota bacterium]
MTARMRPFAGPVTGAVALIVIAAAAMLLAGASPTAGFAALLRGALGGPHQVSETLVQTTSLLFPSLAVAFAFRAGLFNIGAEGQLVMGGLCAGLAGAALAVPGWVAIPLILLAGAAGGAAWGGVAGVLRARFGGNEVIATLMLNIIAALLANYLVVGPLHAPDATGAETSELPRSSWLPLLLPDSRLSVALLFGIAFAVLLAYVFRSTAFGYALRAAGDAPEAARRAGIDLRRTALVAMALSGAIAGFGGATIVAGVLHRFNVALSPGYGFIAIAVALVGGLDPLWILVASFAFGILQSGSLSMQAYAHVPKDVVTFVEGLAILALATRRFVAPRTAGT